MKNSLLLLIVTLLTACGLSVLVLFNRSEASRPQGTTGTAEITTVDELFSSTETVLTKTASALKESILGEESFTHSIPAVSASAASDPSEKMSEPESIRDNKGITEKAGDTSASSTVSSDHPLTDKTNDADSNTSDNQSSQKQPNAPQKDNNTKKAPAGSSEGSDHSKEDTVKANETAASSVKTTERSTENNTDKDTETLREKHFDTNTERPSVTPADQGNDNTVSKSTDKSTSKTTDQSTSKATDQSDSKATDKTNDKSPKTTNEPQACKHTWIWKTHTETQIIPAKTHEVPIYDDGWDEAVNVRKIYCPCCETIYEDLDDYYDHDPCRGNFGQITVVDHYIHHEPEILYYDTITDEPAHKETITVKDYEYCSKCGERR